MRLYHAICELIEAKAHMYRQDEPEPPREVDIGSQAEQSEGYVDNSMRIGFNRSQEDVFDDPMERRK